MLECLNEVRQGGGCMLECLNVPDAREACHIAVLHRTCTDAGFKPVGNHGIQRHHRAQQ
jgi:hypothetical protein